MVETVLFARQPIFDSRQNVYGYELLFRNGEVDKADFIDGDLATKSVLLNAYAESSAPVVLNGKPGFLNVSRTMMSAIPAFARQFLVVEVLEQAHADDVIVEDVKDLQSRGFQVVLDDFEMKHYRPDLIENVDIVKLDVLTYSQQELAEAVDELSQHSVKLLAEKVETHDIFNLCKSLGFDLFQGYFFCRPELVKGHVMDANRRAIFDLLRELYQPDVDIPKLAEIVKRDVVLSYKILKLVNSSFYRREKEIESIEQAVMVLGMGRIRSWVTLVSMGKLNQKPDELQKESLMRAHMCEKLGESADDSVKQICFSAGLLSCLDAWFDYPIPELMSGLPLSEDLSAAVMKKEGKTGEILQFVIDATHSNWDSVTEERLQKLNLSSDLVSEAYAFAVEQTDQISTLMMDE